MRLMRKSKPQPSRARRAPRPNRRPWRWALSLAAVAAVGGAATFAASSGWADRQLLAAEQAFFEASAAAGLAVGDVLVEGRTRTPAADVLAALGVAKGTPSLAFDPIAARERLLELPWVSGAQVERRLPDLVYVRLDEREPLALWQLDGRLSVIDAAGSVIQGAEPARFAELPLLVGEGAPERAQALLFLLQRAPELAAKVVAAVRVGERRWNVVLEGDIEVRLPEVGAAKAWQELARMVRDEALLDRDVVMIDLRLPDRAILRGHNAPEPAWRRAASGEET